MDWERIDYILKWCGT